MLVIESSSACKACLPCYLSAVLTLCLQTNHINFKVDFETIKDAGRMKRSQLNVYLFIVFLGQSFWQNLATWVTVVYPHQ